MKDQEGNNARHEVANPPFCCMIRMLLLEGKLVRLRVTGMSMWPILQSGRDLVDLILAESIEPGDLVLAQVQPDVYLLHRVIDKNGDKLTLMGDGNLHAREQCLCSDVVGKVVLIIRNGHIVPLNSRLYRTYSLLWMKLNPLKKYVFTLYRFFSARNGFKK